MVYFLLGSLTRVHLYLKCPQNFAILLNFLVVSCMWLHHILNLFILPRLYTDQDCSSYVTRFIKCMVLIFPPITFDHLRYCLLFKFILLCHIYVGCTNISFYERLSFNPFWSTFVHFTISFDLVWLDIIIYSNTHVKFCSGLSTLEYLFQVFNLRH